MTIKFFCPNCGELIAFEDKHAGKRATCMNCRQRLIIPAESNQVPELVTPEPVEDAEPLEGYYKALFLQTWNLFANPENTTTLVFVITLVGFKFWLARGPCCCGFVTHVVVWGWLFSFYLNCIEENAFDIDALPKIELGSGPILVWLIVKPLLIFSFTMTIVQLPLILALMFTQKHGVTLTNMWTLKPGLQTVLQGLFAFGMFLFPMAILVVTVGRDITLLRIDYFVKPIKKAILPYLTIFALMMLLGASIIVTFPMQLALGQPYHILILHLAANFAVQLIAIFAMRSIALFYRHYNCYMKW